ncbi:MAG TPA: NFACT RNA binding domain-containing protein [Chloroflexota bacterium]|nr:NFACT RNA binding domain-containing protein [Chloroflexota bacterium]
MPFDSMALAAVTDEAQAIAGGQIQRIIQPSEASIALAVYASGLRRWLLVSADARLARVVLSEERLAKAFDQPSSFVMLLRKYLEGARITSVRQTPYERVLTVDVIHGEDRVELVAEIMGKHSNIVLVSSTSTILGAVKMVPPARSRVRPVLPGREYAPPPAHDRDQALYGEGPRLNPREDPDQVAALLATMGRAATLRVALLGLLPGCSPFLADQIAYRAGADPQAPADSAPTETAQAAGELYALPESHDWHPCTFLDERGRCGFAPYLPLRMEAVCPAPSISAAVDTCVGAVESRDPLANTRREILSRLARDQSATSRRIRALEEGLSAATGAEEIMLQGQLLLAYQHLVTPGSTTLEIPDLGTHIELEPRLSPADNAERRFKRYRKLREAARRIPGLLADARTEDARLRDLEVFARLADSPTALRDIAEQIEPPRQRKEAPRHKRPRGPMRLSKGGHVALVGRNARENEEVTFGMSGRTDLWLHARERTGAHVVLKGTDPTPEVVEAAAALAAYFSEGRSDSAVDVDVALVRDVRKIPGGPPGRVTYRSFRTVRVRPGAEGWTPAAVK